MSKYTIAKIYITIHENDKQFDYSLRWKLYGEETLLGFFKLKVKTDQTVRMHGRIYIFSG